MPLAHRQSRAPSSPRRSETWSGSSLRNSPSLQTGVGDTGQIQGRLEDGIGGFAVFRFEGLALDSQSPTCAGGCPTALDVFYFDVDDPQRRRANHTLRIQSPDGTVEVGGGENDVPLVP